MYSPYTDYSPHFAKIYDTLTLCHLLTVLSCYSSIDNHVILYSFVVVAMFETGWMFVQGVMMYVKLCDVTCIRNAFIKL